MSQKAFISYADEVLSNLVWKGVEKESASKNLVLSHEQISFSSPKTVGTHGLGKLSIFLYNITVEPVFALHYLVTPLSANDKDAHSLLEKIIHVFFQASTIASSDDDSIRGFRVKMDSLSVVEMSNLWIALGTPLRACVSLTLTFDETHYDSLAVEKSSIVSPKMSTPETEPVMPLYQAVLKTFTEQSTGWRKRNIVFKQWVLQDFKKNADMTVEEMTMALSSLGNKIERHEPTAQFIKPLNLLAGYYKHQLDQLSGMQKVSRNQDENIESINTWIKDIENLIGVLEE